MGDNPLATRARAHGGWDPRCQYCSGRFPGGRERRARKALMAGARKAPYRLRRDETIVRGPVALMRRMVRGMRIRMVLGRGYL